MIPSPRRARNPFKINAASRRKILCERLDSPGFLLCGFGFGLLLLLGPPRGWQQSKQIERLEQYCHRLSAIGDRINGPRPAEVTDDGTAKMNTPQSVISSIRARRNHLQHIADHIERTVQALEGTI